MDKKPANRPIKVGLISLGCAKNLVDGEIMLGTLLKEGLHITNDATEADVVIVNTCSFIDSAQEESIDAILQSAEVRKANNRGQGLVVSGCLPQRFREELPKLLPEVDAFVGIDQVTQVGQVVREVLARRKGPAGFRKPKSEEPKPKTKILSRLASLDQRQAERHGNGERVPARMPHGLRVTNQESPTTHHASQGAFVAVNPRPTYIPDFATPRFRLTPPHFAYLKIAEGCNHPCSFCTIPRMRGSHRSRPQPDVLAEAKELLADRVKELNLISQDSTYYGLDLRPNHSRAIASPDKFAGAVKLLRGECPTICSLLRALNELEGDFWIRLLYTHPAHWTDELIQTIAECPKVARYVDIPLQHIHENMLERMRRETSQKYIMDLLQRIRAGIPGIALRTTFIVGFPGESGACFQTLLDFIRSARFERLGVFAYSQETGTRAGNMGGQISAKLKRERRELAMAAQHEVAVQVSESFVGRALKVLIEKEADARELRSARIHSWEHGLIRVGDGKAAHFKGRYLVARGEADAPDIDGRVYIRTRATPGANQPRMAVGEFALVKVVGHTDYDLIAEPVQST